VTVCRYCVNRHFGETYRLHFQRRQIHERGTVVNRYMQPAAHAGSPLADFSTLKMEAIRSSETSANALSTQCHIPEDDILHSHRCESLKSYKKGTRSELQVFLHI
jgi:alkylhydroperoxidase family enzyme